MVQSTVDKDLLLVTCVSTLNTQVMGELAASLEGAVRVATAVIGAVALALTLSMLVGSMAALHAKVVSELASGLEGAIGVTLEVVSTQTKPQAAYDYLRRCRRCRRR